MATAAERADFLRRDRERLHRMALGERESVARLRTFASYGSDPVGRSSVANGGNVGVEGAVRAALDEEDDFKDAASHLEDGDDDEGDLEASEPEPVSLPESTHSLFFTQPVCSVPFAFAFFIVGVSILCLIMAFEDNLGLVQGDLDPDNRLGVPANVDSPVKIAQYLGILIAILMEEEIPTGVYLLRMIPKSSFKKKFPNKSYARFVAAALLRLVLGYIFLFNVLVILVKATAVLDIFYDVLALQFISELDDIAFSLCKLDVLGKKLQRACTQRLFQTEFERQKFSKTKAASVLLKSVYVLNLAAFLTPMIIVSEQQRMGNYQCGKIEVDFGDAVWAEALAETFPGVFLERTLAFSTFNGIYRSDGKKDGRPVYVETRKFDRGEYDLGGFETGLPNPARIEYSKEVGSWIFVHDQIKKKEGDEPGSWLLRSPETNEYDLLNVDSDWSIWYGVIDTTHLTYTCADCQTDVDCNLNGKCMPSGEGRVCVCDHEEGEEGVEYLGEHCEVQMKDKCRSIEADLNGTDTIYSISYYPDENGEDTLFRTYNRPVYVHIQGLPDVKEDDINWIIYTGRRWKYLGFNMGDRNMTVEDLIASIVYYHAFWFDAFRYDPLGINFISDPTTGDNPVGVDWYQVVDFGDQFGPFGALVPVNERMGLFRCAGEYFPDIADAPSCPDDCQYEGCYREGFTIPGLCDPDSGCVHGILDEKCEGIPDLQQYEGMESFEGSDQMAFCFKDPESGGALKVAQCPAMKGPQPAPVPEDPALEDPAPATPATEVLSCPDDCQYEGCYREGFTIPGLCDPDSGCVHGTLDEKCKGIPDLQQYEGMESFEGSDQMAFCFKDPESGVALKVAQCPAMKGPEPAPVPEDPALEDPAPATPAPAASTTGVSAPPPDEGAAEDVFPWAPPPDEGAAEDALNSDEEGRVPSP